jgi:hypothetical protein
MIESPVVFGYIAQLKVVEDPHVIELLDQRARRSGRSLPR